MTIVSYLHVQIETTQPVTIADPERAGAIHRPMTLDHRGEVYVPATGLIGSLRAHLEDAEIHLGADRPQTDQDPITPSRLRALGSAVTRHGDPITVTGLRTRSQTGIDSARGAAASRMLRTSQELPTGALIELWCEYDGPIPASLITALLGWQPTIGGGRTSGLGAARMVSVAHGSLDLAQQNDLANYLDHGGPGLVAAAITRTETNVTPPADRPIVRLTATIADAYHSFGGIRSEPEKQTNVQLVLRNSNGQPTVEGSSLKGVLRSRVSSIAASIVAARHDFDGDGNGDDQAAACGHRIADAIFGTVDRRGCVAVQSAPVTVTASQERPHVAIDRFTGGAAPGLLFKEEVVTEGTFEIRVDAISETVPPYTRPLLLAACADIDAGYCGIGAKTGRGFGTVTLTPRNEIVGALPLFPDVVDQILADAFPPEPAEPALEAQHA